MPSSSNTRMFPHRCPTHAKSQRNVACACYGATRRVRVHCCTSKACRSMRICKLTGFANETGSAADLDINAIRQNFSFSPSFGAGRKNSCRSEHNHQCGVRILIMSSPTRSTLIIQVYETRSSLQRNLVLTPKLRKARHFVLVPYRPPFRAQPILTGDGGV